ncbi:MAG: cytochrome P450 [Caulobacterales bacterium]|nr:cytochrome P450 [Caulobacterales bacterium]
MEASGAVTARVEDFSLMDPQVQSRPYDFYALLHEHEPVYRMPETGMYVVTRYADVRAVLQDCETFSNDVELGFGVNGAGYQMYQDVLDQRGWRHVQTLQRTDPPRHGRYRKLLDQVFNVLRVQQLTPHIEEVANDLIDGFIDQGECEFVSAFALPLPGIIIAEQLGLNRNEIATFKAWCDAIISPASVAMSEAELRATAEVELEMQHFLAAQFEDRRRNPGPDLISGLVNAAVEGEEPLSMHELQSLMEQLIAGGYDTTISALANGLWLLLRHPEQMAKLRADPALLKGFVEESLRYESPVQGLVRRATRPVEIAGVTIPKDAIVMVRYAAANRDPAKFACPHQFDIERSNAAAHMAFGVGTHFCVGRLLAKQELMTGFSILLARLGEIELARPVLDPPHHPSLIVHGMRELHIRFSGRSAAA